MPKDERYRPVASEPRGLLEKLGVRPGMRVSLLGVRDEAFRQALESRGADLSRRLRGSSDVIFAQIDRPEGLERLLTLRRALRPEGAIWAITPKRTAGLRDVDIIAAAKAAGLVDNKISAFSETHTATRLVIPRALR